MLPNKQTKLNLAILLMAAALSMAGVGYAATMGTAFTYQGLLTDANGLAEGLYDFQFMMYDSLSGGNQVAIDVNKQDVDVIEGYFTVELDFGGTVYEGNSVWLEIKVRPGGGGGGAYSALTPRQRLTVIPYAVHALSAGTVRYGLGTVQINLSSLTYENVGFFHFNYLFSSEPVVMITGTANSGNMTFILPQTANVLTTGFELVLANPTAQTCIGTYAFNWVAFGDGNKLNVWYKDADGDDYSDGTKSETAIPPAGYYLVSDLIAISGDCDDTDPTINPAATETWYDDADQNCDGLNDYDQDMDGYVDENYNGQAGGSAPGTGDCDDTDSTIYPGATEYCNGLDNDCDGSPDNGCVFQRSCTDQQMAQVELCLENCEDDPLDCLNLCLDDLGDENCSNAVMAVLSCGFINGCISSQSVDLEAARSCLAQACWDDYLNVFGYPADNDEDGYHEYEDCDDGDPQINPGASEICDDEIDNDCDGFVDCYDPDCFGAGCQEICDDAQDNDGDGDVDCDDSDCFEECPEICDDNLDNDGDGLIDCYDPDCFGAGCQEICDDAGDNDGDGDVDCDDWDCSSLGYCDDAYEDNDDMQSATIGVSNETGLVSIYLDDDWFAIEVCAGGTINVNILFTHVNGDIDLYLLDSEHQELAASLTSTDNETVSWTNTGGSPETVYILVRMFSTEGINTYDLDTLIESCP